ncbi:putative phosphoglycerate mutase [Agromyces terreus]|uniref:Phosphoglycerate mutase n=1 Tax=Agromyces terreus TaxID=424795 RepID=A0A9X2H0B5_9MICO|nr:histidine phosphatase family protein [Agromyces terreus]MCP2371962.1 putative phosphoglycerate mutase [Agromyces terreus]
MTDATPPIGLPATRFAIVRHGETDWNVQRRIQGATDIPLNDTGRAQAVETAASLAGRSWNAIVSSPLSRASETADLIAAALDLDQPDIVPALAERSHGVLEGLDHGGRAAVEAQAPTIEGLEPRSAVVERARAALLELASTHPGEDVIVVTHGGVIHALMLDLSDWTFPTPGYAIENGSVHEVLARDGRLVFTRPDVATGTDG